MSPSKGEVYGTRVEHGTKGCDAPTIRESDPAAIEAISLALENRDGIIATLQKNVETVIRQDDESHWRALTSNW